MYVCGREPRETGHTDGDEADERWKRGRDIRMAQALELQAGPPSRASALSLIELPRNVHAIVANAAGVRSMSSTGHPTQRSTILTWMF
jgi:hypothetical protein